jgi:hypothetical protein
MLEPCDAKVSRTVPSGLDDREVVRLLGKNAKGAHMLETFWGTRTLRYLWHEQRGQGLFASMQIGNRPP